MEIQAVAYDVTHAAVACGVSESTIRKAITRGDVEVRWLGSKMLIPVESLRAWVASLPKERKR